MSRNRFNALLLAARDVDRSRLEQVGHITQLDEEDETANPIVQQVTRHRHPLSSFLLSTTVHLILFLILAVSVIPWSEPRPTIGVIADLMPADPLVEDRVTDPENQTIEITLPEQTQSPIEMEFDDVARTTELRVSDASNTLPSPVQSLVSPERPVPVVEAAPNRVLPSGGGLEGRDQATRARLAASRGGSAASEAAVERGLAWIIEHQRSDGSWRLRHDDGRCQGQCPNEGRIESTTAATGLALLSLLGAGYTHRSGPYQTEIENGLTFLVNAMRMSRHGGSLATGDRGMYSHAIATIALSEAYAMTRDTWLINPLDSARKYIVSAQHKKGGWRYVPGNAGDMTVTGWQLMALKSCQMSGFPSEPEVWNQAEAFIDSLRTSSGCYGYLKPSEHPTTTAVGVLMKMYLGATPDNADVENGSGFVAGQGHSPTDIYFNYYATQVLHHRGGAEWKLWNQKMRDYLVETQDRSGAHRTGSWYYPDQHAEYGGRLYTTAMAVMTLEVYYRYMPLYGEDVIADDRGNGGR